MSDMARATDMRVISGDAMRTRSDRDVEPLRGVHASRHVRETQQEPTLLERIQDAGRRAFAAIQNHPGIFITFLTIFAVIVMLYGPMRDWYVSMRSGQDLETYYAALAEQNGALLGDLERLQTHEGIEDEARKRGYVNPDETGVLVENLPDVELALPDRLEVSYETTWDQKILDFVFGYTAGQWQ